jgi:transposase InsO family protein
MNRRGRAQPPRTSRPPTTHIATRPGDVWCWDVTFLPAQIQGRWFYFYLILDLYSRKIVGFEVHDTDSAEHAAHLARRTALAEGVHAKPVRPVLHGDNGATPLCQTSCRLNRIGTFGGADSRKWLDTDKLIRIG